MNIIRKFDSQFYILTGIPGTGKTTTLKELANTNDNILYFDISDEEIAINFKIEFNKKINNKVFNLEFLHI